MQTIRQQKSTDSDVPWGPALRLPSWNALLAWGDEVAVRAGWAGRARAASWVLWAQPSAVPSAQRVTAARMAAWGLHEQADAADLLVGELVTQALRDATGAIRLTLQVEDGLLRGEVEDTGPRPDAGPHQDVDARPGWDAGPDPAADRDLPLMARLACCWGVAGRAAWFELPVSEPD